MRTRETIFTRPVQVYLIARIARDAHARNKKIANDLGPGFEVFLPHEHNPWNQAHETFQQEVFDTDRAAMLRADLGLAVLPFGRDCSWEVGWFSNSSKPVVAYVENIEKNWLRDWMIKAGITAAVTPNPKMFDVLQRDPILGKKCLYTPTPVLFQEALAGLTAAGPVLPWPASQIVNFSSAFNAPRWRGQHSKDKEQNHNLDINEP